MSETKPDTVPGLGFKDKEKALETLKNLEGRDPDYQKLAVKGLIGRAKRTLTLTKDKEKLQNINDAMAVFDDFLKNYELKNMSKENRSYLPIAHIDALLPLKEKFKIASKEIDSFLEAYRTKAKGDYKALRTVSSGDDKPTWDIVRNKELKKLLKAMEDDSPDLWKDDLPTKEHMELILWAYSPDASKIKKNVSVYESKLGTGKKDEDEDEDMEEEKEEKKKPKKEKSSKRKSSSSDGSEDEGSPKKKSKE